ncbi:MAG: PBP1A family penicillin-binding protein [Candidatus Eisenbacteria bacterium]
MTPPTTPPSGGTSRRDGGSKPPFWAWRPSWLPAGRARWFLFLLLLVVGFLGYDWYRLSAIGSNRYAGKGWKFPTRVYADWREWKLGDRMAEDDLRDALERARYRRVWKKPAAPGEYRVKGATYELRLRPFVFPEHVERGGEVSATIGVGALATLTEGFENPRPRGVFRIEPELLAEFSDLERERRSFVPLNEIPRHVVQAVVASEDRRFFRHYGIDLLGLGRATMRNVRAGGVVEGGSTLSQQLVKNLFLSRERNVFRKFHEALLAVMLELRYSKEEILEFYLNQIYLGQRGSWSLCGLEEAALFYFNKHARELTVPEGALLAGIIPAPNRLSPYRDPEVAIERRNDVLSDMVECGWLGKDEAKKFRRQPMRFAPSPPPTTRAPYFIDYVREALARDISEADLNARGFSIFTTLDSRMQSAAERQVRDGAREADWRSPVGGSERHPAQASLFAMEPSTGYVRAMVGGRNYAESSYNRAVDSRRQPGSAFKPFVYLAALDTPFQGRRPALTAATLLEDLPDTFVTDVGPWAPRNFEEVYEGRVTAARALARSLNVATVHLELEVGIPKVIQMAKTLGVESRLRNVPSLALGACEVSVLEMTRAYAALANDGVMSKPIAVRAVLDRGGNVRWSPKREQKRAIRAETAYMGTVLLQGPVIYGTAAGIRSQFGFMRPAAGKTGTTSDENDAWFIGYTPQLACGVWVGCDKGRRLGLTGTQAAVPIWAHFMDVAHRGKSGADFEPPPGVVEVWIDAETGYRAGAECPRVMRAAFVPKSEPRQVCGVFHPPAWMDSTESGMWGEDTQEGAPPTGGEDGTPPEANPEAPATGEEGTNL